MRIGIVNDLPLVVEALRRVLALHSEHRVAWVARDGAEAVAMCASDTPDLVLMDLLMPGIDGVEATRRIMQRTPCPILIVTVSVGAHAGRVFEAMGHGALDAVDTPVLKGDAAQGGAEALLDKIDRIERLVRARPAPAPPANGVERSVARAPQRPPLLAIGASAGGPAALAVLLRALPADLRAAVVIVQHVDAQFAPGMADWLGQQSALPVRLAQESDRLQAGTVLVAGRADHLVLRRSAALGYVREPADYHYRPSVDVFFHSVARFWADRTVGVLLTGMGRDGALGLKALRDHGCHTIAQDASTSAVYGMPKAAAQVGAAVDILPLPQIAAHVVAALSAIAVS
ncbi:MAG: cheB [Panacagrimonas sp.]|jgi:chemotaxis response regulator CheB|nr:chemotaxis response regulator protein-glutamate methylesterase [Panacagrimonas sp.]MCC2656916.1 cheB [Panacagrimonas sp.]